MSMSSLTHKKKLSLQRRPRTVKAKELTQNENLRSPKSVLIKQSRFIDSEFKKAKSIQLEELGKPKQTKSTTQPFAFVITHNPRNPHMFKAIKRTI